MTEAALQDGFSKRILSYADIPAGEEMPGDAERLVEDLLGALEKFHRLRKTDCGAPNRLTCNRRGSGAPPSLRARSVGALTAAGRTRPRSTARRDADAPERKIRVSPRCEAAPSVRA